MIGDIVRWINQQIDEDERRVRLMRALGFPTMPQRLAQREVEGKRALLAAIFEYEAKIDGEWGCCHEPDDIAAGRCRDANANGIPALGAFLTIYHGRPGLDPAWPRYGGGSDAD